jgi:hypothetical protein
MRYALNLAEDGRILSVTFPKYAPEAAVIVDTLPDGDTMAYRYVAGEYVLDPIPADPVEVANERIEELKGLLRDTDYHILKVVEGATTLAACAEVILKRAAWRREINELEKQMEGVTDGQ